MQFGLVIVIFKKKSHLPITRLLLWALRVAEIFLLHLTARPQTLPLIWRSYGYTYSQKGRGTRSVYPSETSPTSNYEHKENGIYLKIKTHCSLELLNFALNSTKQKT
jgi:hypothetical protein